jgi:hypothetical protein
MLSVLPTRIDLLNFCCRFERFLVFRWGVESSPSAWERPVDDGSGSAPTSSQNALSGLWRCPLVAARFAFVVVATGSAFCCGSSRLTTCAHRKRRGDRGYRYRAIKLGKPWLVRRASAHGSVHATRPSRSSLRATPLEGSRHSLTSRVGPQGCRWYFCPELMLLLSQAQAPVLRCF